MLLGFDVSHHQPTINFARAKREGLGFVICKATQGTSMTDETFTGRRRAAAAAGLAVGAYHFLTRRNASAQAKHFYDTVMASGGFHGLGVAVDVELQSESPPVGPSIDDAREFVAAFRRMVPGKPLILYTGAWYWRGYLGDSKACADLPLWTSSYVRGAGSAADIFAHGGGDGVTPGHFPAYGGWTSYAIRQYSANATVAGVAPVDVNFFPGSTADLLKLFGDGVKPAPRPKAAGHPPPTNLRRMLHLTSPHMHGGDVALLQQWLNYRGARLAVDGDFGPATDRAVRSFQARAGIPADGKVWRQTTAALWAGTTKHTP